jgi:Protein of unknown function (DUF4239)
MLTFAQNIVILVSAMVVSLGFMAGLNRLWPIKQRYVGNDQIGWQLSVLGTTYAVILGFMLYNEWNNFRSANLNVDLEASALRNIYRLSEALPQPQRQQVNDLTHAYARAAIAQDWPQMQAGQLPNGTHLANERLWTTLLAVRAGSGSESLAQSQALSELSALTTHRRTRLLESTQRLPSIFWAVLLTGGVLTTLSVSMFGSISAKLHTFQVFSITLLVTLAMLAISDVGRPFHGWVHVSEFAFERALENMAPLD